MGTQLMFYTEDQVKELLKKQRMICFLANSSTIVTEEPELPKGLTEWQMMGRLFNTQDKTENKG